MRFVKPTAKAPRNPGGSSSTFSDCHKPLRRPDWLIEWIQDQNKYVRLKCGHIVDINEKGNCEVRILNKVFPGMTLIKTFCWKCDDYRDVVKGATYKEYLGLPKTEYSQEPLF